MKPLRVIDPKMGFFPLPLSLSLVPFTSCNSTPIVIFCLWKKIIPQEAHSILVIDDELSNVESLANILEFEKDTVIHAAGGEAGPSIEDRENVDLMMLDIMVLSLRDLKSFPGSPFTRKQKTLLP
jgi:hypothetical protein